ncbi:MAG: two-component system, sensor histidine kinase [Actinomycetota bacterium]|nr:two-component system, sensor histidine kinase [Actinomycetota bacterium]
MEDPPLKRGVIGELFWKISDPVLIVGAGRITALNPAAEAGFRVTAEDVTAPGYDITSMLGPAADQLMGLVGTESTARLDFPHLGATFIATSFVVDDRNTGVLLRDVTSDQRYLESLRRLNEIAREVLSQDSVEVVLQRIVDEAKTLTQASFSALLMLQDESDEEVAKFIYNAPRELFPDRLPRVVGLLKVPIQTKAPARLDDIRGHPAGVGIPVAHPPIEALLAVPIVTDGNVLGEIAVANQPGKPIFTESDEAILTELGLHAVQAIRMAQAREESLVSDASHQAMLDLLRHDMMTPIATAKGATDLLITQFEVLTGEQRDRLLRTAGRAIEGIERMGRNLRSDARLETPQLEEGFTDIKVSVLVEELSQDLRTHADDRGISFEVVIGADCPDSFRGAHLLVRQALENLLTNALKFSPDGQKVVITARREGESVRFDVRDEGPGVPLEDQADLFQRFRRGARAGEPPRIGLGLGLSIVKRVAEAHGGAVGLASRPNQGCTFWITFPLVPPLRSIPS